MNIIPFQALACPLDGAPLRRNDSTWRCAAGHSFDIASQGYTHLLPVQKKRSFVRRENGSLIGVGFYTE